MIFSQVFVFLLSTDVENILIDHVFRFTQLILESEMDKARNEQGIMGSEFHKPPGAGGSRPSSSMSNRSGQPNDVRETK